MEAFEQALALYPWGIYALVALTPFVQEDAAIIGAAAASSTGTGEPALLFCAVLAGLFFSDTWKYWIGRAALTRDWAKRIADKPSVRNARDRVVHRLGATLLAVRFIPGTRIPFYIASGFFNAPFLRFAALVALSAALYIAIAFVVFHALGAAMGEHLTVWLPVVAIGLIACIILGLWIKGRLRAQ